MEKSCTKSDSAPLGTALVSIPVPVTQKKKKKAKHKEISPKLINTLTGAEPQLGINCISSSDHFSLKGSIFVLNSRHLVGHDMHLGGQSTK